VHRMTEYNTEMQQMFDTWAHTSYDIGSRALHILFTEGTGAVVIERRELEEGGAEFSFHPVYRSVVPTPEPVKKHWLRRVAERLGLQ
jgi:hypothetical protein